MGLLFEARTDRAWMLEIMPLAALLLLPAAIALPTDVTISATLITALASGLGWWRAGMRYTAMLVFALRGFILLALLFWGLSQQVTSALNQHYFPGETQTGSNGTLLLAAALGFFILSTLLSAGMLVAVSRRSTAIS
jgi:hypothetical protein